MCKKTSKNMKINVGNAIHEQFMRRALELAKEAALMGEVPVGAVLVVNNQIVGEGYNKRESLHCPIAHAEMIAIKEAANRLKSWRLLDGTLYSTLEPCIMCSGAVLHARINQVIFGAYDPKFGGLKSLYNLSQDERLNHRFLVIPEVLADESISLLTEFFAELRSSKKTFRGCFKQPLMPDIAQLPK
jgi:tRNA(adenine34) deaminase